LGIDNKTIFQKQKVAGTKKPEIMTYFKRGYRILEKGQP
jgi:hypothetical protein